MNDQIDDAIQYNKNEEPIVISKPTSDRLLKLERPADAMALYWFYYYTAKWQHSNTPHANNHYVTTGLKWTDDRLSRAKKDLINLGLIEQPPRQWNPRTKHIGYPQIKINFIWWDKNRMSSYSPVVLPPRKSKGVGNEPIKGSTGTLNEESNNIVKKESLSLTAERAEDVCWMHLATFLSKIVLSQRKIATPTQKIKAWARELKKLSTVEKVPFDRVKVAMKWYANNYGGAYIPIAECGRSFRDKFAKIEAAMARDMTSSTNGNNAPTRPANTPQTPSCPEAEQLHKLVARFLDPVTADEGIAIINKSVQQMKAYQAHLKVVGMASQNEWHPFLKFFDWASFFKRWVTFLEEKQSSFRIQSIYNLQVGESRWREFIGDCGRFGNCEMSTGRILG